MSVLFDLLADFWGDIADWLIEKFTGKQRRRPQKSSPSKIEQIENPVSTLIGVDAGFLFFSFSKFPASVFSQLPSVLTGAINPLFLHLAASTAPLRPAGTG